MENVSIRFFGAYMGNEIEFVAASESENEEADYVELLERKDDDYFSGNESGELQTQVHIVGHKEFGVNVFGKRDETHD